MSETAPRHQIAGALEDLVPGILKREPRALARALSLMEDGGRSQRELMRRIYSATGRAHLVGVTGPPGAGKSTVLERLALVCRERGETVGILAVDPTSPYSGGALLGDRIRMQALYTDPGVFIRSMATRGKMGGLAPATRDGVDLLDAAGFDWIFVETVGVGQDEVDVVRTVDTVLVITVPGLGDDIQAIKAGIMEIADLFVVNKADREGVERTVRDLEGMLAMAEDLRWRPPILQTVASRDEGIREVLAETERHGEWLKSTGELRKRRFAHLRRRVETILTERVVTAADRLAGLDEELEQAFGRQEDPYQVADRLFARVVALEGEEEDA